MLLHLRQDGAVLFLRAIADVQEVWLTQTHAGLHEVLDSRAKGAEITLQDPGAALVLGLKLGRHGWPCLEQRAERPERANEASEPKW